LYADAFRLGDIIVGFTGIARYVGQNAGESIVWKTSSVVLKRMSLLKTLPEDYIKMIETSKRETGCQAVLSRTNDDAQSKYGP
jgi:hypothetical protein